MWEECFYERWWPATGAWVTLTFASGEQTSGRVKSYVQGVDPTPRLVLWQVGSFPVDALRGIEVQVDAASTCARGEATQAAALALVAASGDGGGGDAR